MNRLLWQLPFLSLFLLLSPLAILPVGAPGAGHEDFYLRIGPVFPAGPDDVANVSLAEGCRIERESYLVWVTHYWAPLGTPVASEHPEGFRPSIAASYPIYDRGGRLVAAEVAGIRVEFGQQFHVEGYGKVELQDTGEGFEDGRLWLDIAVSSKGEALERGARWAIITWREAN